MTDITKYRNVSLTHDTYKKIDNAIQNIITGC